MSALQDRVNAWRHRGKKKARMGHEAPVVG
jgi:hypothetical protein